MHECAFLLCLVDDTEKGRDSAEHTEPSRIKRNNRPPQIGRSDYILPKNRKQQSNFSKNKLRQADFAGGLALARPQSAMGAPRLGRGKDCREEICSRSVKARPKYTTTSAAGYAFGNGHIGKPATGKSLTSSVIGAI